MFASGKPVMDLSKLGSQAQSSAFGKPAEDDLTHGIDLYDSEVIAIGGVIERLRTRASKSVHYDTFQKEIKDRFADIGLVVDVLWYETDQADVKMPEIVIKARTESHTFDRDRMVHEVTNDILGLGEGGVIKTDKGQVESMIDGSYRGQAHQH